MASLRPVLQPRVHERFLDAPRSFGKNGDAGRRHLPCVCHNHACRSVNGFAWCVTSRLSIRLQEHVYMFCQFSHHKFLLFDWMFCLWSHPWFRALSLTDFSVAFILLFGCLFDFSFVFVGDTFAFARLFHTSRCTLLCWYAFFPIWGEDWPHNDESNNLRATWREIWCYPILFFGLIFFEDHPSSHRLKSHQI